MKPEEKALKMETSECIMTNILEKIDGVSYSFASVSIFICNQVASLREKNALLKKAYSRLFNNC